MPRLSKLSRSIEGKTAIVTGARERHGSCNSDIVRR